MADPTADHGPLLPSRRNLMPANIEAPKPVKELSRKEIVFGMARVPGYPRTTPL